MRKGKPIVGKQCLKCKIEKPAQEFSPDRRRADWLQGECKDCRRDAMEKYRNAHPERAAEIARNHYNRNRSKSRQYGDAWRQRNRDRIRDYGLKARYGMTRKELNALRGEQMGLCAICHKVLTARAHTDHDHATGRVRAILCGGCNIGIGVLERPNEWLSKALEYLRHHGVQTAPRDSGLT